jgi:kumamolisin
MRIDLSSSPEASISTRKHTLLAIALLALTSTTALAAAPLPRVANVADTGALTAIAPRSQLSVTLVMKLNDLAGAETLMNRMSTPGEALYGKFLTKTQFAAQFGPTAAQIARVQAALAIYGLSAERSSTTTLRVTGLPAAMERAFQVSLHGFTVGAQANKPGYSYRAPMQRPTMPAAIAPLVHGVLGLDTRPAAHTNLQRAPAAGHPVSVRIAKAASGTTTPPDAPGLWTTIDYQDYYNVTPLITAGHIAKNATLGIVTLASFTPSDAATYWKNIGLTKKSRITEVQVDGGAGPISDVGGSDETTLDVEQSGGVAPGALIRVYEAPNTSQAFVDAFAQAVDDNIADTISCSWGEWEAYDEIAYSPVSVGGTTVSSLAAYHQIFVQAGVQGQSMFAAAGDAGAYDVNRASPPPAASLTLTVDSPASDPAMTAAGGTTLAGDQTYNVPSGTLTINVPAERVWGWDYLVPLCNDLGYTPLDCGILPVGGGGGISIEYKRPSYQAKLAGVLKSQPDQQFVDYTTVPPTTIYTLPANYAGRNVPDVSANADPETGYVLGYSSSAGGGYAETDYFGGTSFVAPQLNGTAAVIASALGRKRIGVFNKIIYPQAKSTTGGYNGTNPSLNVISAGGNEYFNGQNGYSPAAGVGTLNVANLVAAMTP